MPKKDTATAVLGMLASAGAQTRTVAAVERPTEPTAPEPRSVEPPIDTRPTATVSAFPPAAQGAAASDEPAPRTIRLRAASASHLRAAWLEAKREDVLLQSQDFASTLIDEALAARRRRARSASSS